MPASTTLCSDILSSDIDKEDLQYIQQSFYTLLSGSKHCGPNKIDWNDHKNPESLLCSSFGFLNQQWSDRKSCWTPKSKGRVSTKSSDNSESDSISDLSLDSFNDQLKTLFSNIIHNGVDEEDINFLKRSFNCLLWDSNERYWTSKVCWDFHPATNKVEEESDCKITNDPLNKTGCARTEGYFKMDKLSLPKTKSTQSNMSQTIKNHKTPYSKNYKGNKQTMSRDARNDQRRLFTAYQTITCSDLLKLNELKFRKKKLRLGKSEIHGLGLFACEQIAPNEIIIEYVGQIIRPLIADLREKEYKTSGIGSYCFRIDDDTIVDATKLGNLNRYINHSCNPNSYAKILIINNQKKIVIYSKKAIKVDEEITYDYKMPFEDDKIVCLCRSPACRKSLN